MRRLRKLPPYLAVLVTLSLLVACGGDSASDKPQDDPAAIAWAAVEKTQPDLTAKRQELKSLQSQLAAADEAGAADLKAKADALEKETIKLGDEFFSKLTEYINNAGIAEGAALTPQQRQAFDYLADENMLIAREYIDKGGDYKKALDIYEQALFNDPQNSKLLAAKAEAERLRYMTKDRFDLVKKGMTEAEVRNLLGQVKTSNMRDFEEAKQKGWFYPKEDGGAAGVFFKDGKVVTTNFDQVKAQTEPIKQG
jgi:tetratricopeptide (TPR) repeat protein